MIALDDDHPVLDRSTCPTVLFQLFGNSLQGIVLEVKASYDSYRFAFAALHLTAEPDDPVLFYVGLRLCRTLLLTGACRYRFLTLGADATGFR